MAIVGLVGVGLYFYYSGRESTDDARFEGHVHPVSARIEGVVARVHVVEHQRVEEGELLFELDPVDYEVALARAEADLAEAEAAAREAGTAVPITSTTVQSDLDSARAAASSAALGVRMAEQEVTVAEAERERSRALVRREQASANEARQDVARLRPLAERDEISAREFDQVVARAESFTASEEAAQAGARAADEAVALAQGRLEQARSDQLSARADLATAGTAPQQIEVEEARASSAVARVKQARARLEQARLELSYAAVRSPVAGLVSRKRVEPGQYVRVGQPLLAVVDTRDIWVVANFKETQLGDIRISQRARIAVDAYPGVRLKARVAAIGAATTARFSLLPAENPSGNFVKVVQRVPVKLVLAEQAEPDRPFRPGMSVVATVFTRGPVQEPARSRALTAGPDPPTAP